MWSTTALIISVVGCGTTKVHSSFSGGKATGDSAMSGVFSSSAICAIWVVEGTDTEPISASTLSSVISWRAFFAASVGSVLSSRMMNLTGKPPIVFGISWKAFL